MSDKVAAIGVVIMKPGIKLKDYYTAIAGRENQAVSLETLFAPFNLPLTSIPDPTLAVGFVVDMLAEELGPEDWVTPVEVAAAAADLGYAEAELFLENAHIIFAKYSLLAQITH